MAKTVFCQWCAGEPGDHHPECPFGRAERAEVFARVCNAKAQSYLEQLAVEMARVKELEKWRDAVLRIVDSLDDPPSGLTWDGEPQETCAAELGYLRSVLVPLVRGEGGEDE